MDTQAPVKEEPTRQLPIPATTRIKPEAYDFYVQWAEREDRKLAQVLRKALESYYSQQTQNAAQG